MKIAMTIPLVSLIFSSGCLLTETDWNKRMQDTGTSEPVVQADTPAVTTFLNGNLRVEYDFSESWSNSGIYDCALNYTLKNIGNFGHQICEDCAFAKYITVETNIYAGDCSENASTYLQAELIVGFGLVLDGDDVVGIQYFEDSGIEGEWIDLTENSVLYSNNAEVAYESTTDGGFANTTENWTLGW